MKHSSLFFLLFLPLVAFSQLDAVLKSAQLKEDFRVFRGSLEDFHGGLYWYTSRSEMDSLFNATEERLNNEMTVRELYHEVAAIMAMVRCGHTFMVPSGKDLEKIWKGQLFPVETSIIDRKMYCFRHLTSSNEKIPDGVEITAINGRPTDSLLTYILDRQSVLGDGYTTTGKIQEINDHFSTIYAILFGQPDEFTIEFDLEGRSQVLTVKAKTMEETNRLLSQDPGNGEESEANFQLDFNDGLSLATLKIKLFSNSRKQKFRSTLKKMMQEIAQRHSANLILDLRDNPGGDDEFGLMLFSYLYDRSIVEFEKEEFKVDKSEFFKYSDMSRFKLGILKMMNKTKKVNDSTYLLLSEKSLKPSKPFEPQFRGKLFLLVNGKTFSTGSDVAALLKSYGRATLIGNETGGGYYGNTSGMGITTQLPNSKLRMLTPIIRYTTNVEDTQEIGRGVIPHHFVLPTIQDQLVEEDVELNYATRLLIEEYR